MYLSHLPRLRRHKVLVCIVYALLLHTLTEVDSASSDATSGAAAAASKQNLETLVTTPRQTLVDIGKESNGPYPETELEQLDDKFVDAESGYDDGDNHDDDDDNAEIFHDAMDEPDDRPTDSATSGIADSQPSLIARLGYATKSVVAPAWEYYKLVIRFTKWRNEYNRLQATYGAGPDGQPRMRNSLDVMRLEYAQVDRMLVDEICHGGNENDSAEFYDMDFIWKVLKLLIGRLEAKLDELKHAGSGSSVLMSDYDEATRETLEQIEARASDRVKHIIARSAAHLAKREFIRLVELYLADMLASYVANSDQMDANGVTTLMGSIEPLVFLIGRANSPILLSYLSSIKFRTVFSLAERYYSALSCPRTQKATTDIPQKKSTLVSATITAEPITGH